MFKENKIFFKEIIECLGGTNYEIFNFRDTNSNGYYLASIKKVIINGVYFLTSHHKNITTNIANSIIITDFTPDFKDSNIYIIVENPQLTHYLISKKFERKVSPGIHKSAIVHPDAIIHHSVYIGPFCVIGNCILEENVTLLSHVTVNDNVLIKKNSSIESNSLIGARGMAWIWNLEGERVMQPQLGGVIIGEDCILGSDISIVRGSLSENTVIGNQSIIAHGTKIGHGSYIEKQVHMANNVSLAGNARIGRRAFLGSSCTISSNVTIPEGAIVGAGAVVNRSISVPYSTIVGVPGKIVKTENFNNKPNGAPKPFKK